jgi:hypothetical protein
MVKGLFVGSSYIPTPSCPPYAEPAFNLVLGMDNRRYVLNLSFDEAAKLKNELDYHLNQLSLRRLK